MPESRVIRPRIEPVPGPGMDEMAIAEAHERFSHDYAEDLENWPRLASTADGLPVDGNWILAADGRMFLFAGEGLSGNALIVAPEDCGPKVGFELTRCGTQFHTMKPDAATTVYHMPVTPTAALHPMTLWMQLDDCTRLEFRAWTRVWVTSAVIDGGADSE